MYPREPEEVRKEFDAIVATQMDCQEDEWDHNSHYHQFLLGFVPSPCRSALDIGCGKGKLARRLAALADQVVGIDLSPVSIDRARELTPPQSNVHYEAADMMTWSAPYTFDYVVSIATLHHLSLEPALQRMKSFTRPGGILAVLDLYRPTGIDGLIADCAGVVANLALRRWHTGRFTEPPLSPAARAAAREHAKHDEYSDLLRVRATCRSVLPGAVVRRHMLWRYSIIWHNLET